MSKANDELDGLYNQVESEKDPEKKKFLEMMVDIVSGKNTKAKHILEDVKKLDQHLKTAMTLVLNYYAQSEGQFNQDLLNDAAKLIAKRAVLVKKLK